MKEPLSTVRVDRWLWAARFFKTRGLATDAIRKGRVAVNGVRAKPAKKIVTGDRLHLKKDRVIWELDVLGLSERRLGASLAQALYQETVEGEQARTALQAQYRLQTQAVQFDQKYGRGRPGKHDRRAMIRVKRGG